MNFQMNLLRFACVSLILSAGCVADAPIATMYELLTPDARCPAAVPVSDETCEAGVVCDYGTDDPCDGSAKSTCVEGSFVTLFADPPASCNSACPTERPTSQAACNNIDLRCDYSQTCDPFEAICTVDGWQLVNIALSEECVCPEDKPTVGTPCTDHDKSCSYGTGGVCDAEGPFVCENGSWAQLNLGAPVPPECSCPTDVPEASSSCTREGLSCSYGEDVCDAQYRADCNGGVWAVLVADPGLQCQCPLDAPTDGSMCSLEMLECQYGVDGRTFDVCEANSGALCTNGTWSTSFPDQPLECSCPASEPTMGAACAPTSLSCLYGNGDSTLTTNACDAGSEARCVMGSWSIVAYGQSEECACPAMQPQALGMCINEGLECDYGAAIAKCENSQWSIGVVNPSPGN